MSDHEVKTRRTCEQAFHAQPPGVYIQSFALGWKEALASVILPEGRFEVGQEVEIQTQSGTWEPARIQAVSKDARNYTYFSDYVRPLRKTVDMTVNDKILEVATAMLNKIKPTTSDAMAHEIIGVHIEISQALANGKTIDQLCAEYGVSTTKEDK